MTWNQWNICEEMTEDLNYDQFQGPKMIQEIGFNNSPKP